MFPESACAIFLGCLRDVRLLKTCRLVSKSWNIGASESLRACSKVSVREAATELTDFTRLLLKKAIGPLQYLPSPFRNFHAEGITFTDPTFIDLILPTKIRITSLSLKLDHEGEADLDQSQLSLVLAANQATIENLTIINTAYENETFRWDETLITSDEIKLMALKCLKFEDHCYECPHIQVMKSILGLCQPERIDLLFENSESLDSLLTQDKVENLKHLVLDLDISTDFWEHLRNLRFPMLRHLTLRICDYVGLSGDHDQWRSICQNVSPLLEELVTNVPIRAAWELNFPNLKTMEIASNTNLSAFTPEKFPFLVKVIYLEEFRCDTLVEHETVPHEGVHSLEIHINYMDIKNHSFHYELMVLLTYVSRQFPKVSSLTFSISKYCCTTLADIFEAFPKLKVLNLLGRCDFLCISGMDMVMLTQYLVRGWSIERIPRRKSITDFMDLETIIFGKEFVIDTGMMLYCLPRIPNLRQIRFHWNESLSVPLLSDSMGHLERIVILNSADKKFQDAMAQLAKLLPKSVIL